MAKRRIGEKPLSELVTCFSALSDPRVRGRCKHLLIDVVVIAICAVLCGAESCLEFEVFAQQKESWLRRFLSLPSGIPSHDTFLRVLSLVDPNEMEKIFADWVRSIVDRRDLRTVSLDGKSVQGTGSGFNTGHRPLHLVSAYCHELGLSIAQSESPGTGSGEAEAALDVLGCLDIRDVLVMADAGLAIHRVVSRIREKKGHYLVALKGNQKFYLQQTQERFESAMKLDHCQSQDSGHGRKETRQCSVLEASSKELDPKFFEQWPGLKTLIRVCRIREEKDGRYSVQRTGKDGKQSYEKNRNQGGVTRSEEISYYLSSKKLGAEEALREIRKHWGIENGLHWILDVAFGEDDWPVRAKQAARNLSLIRKIGFNLIRQSKTSGSIRGRMKSAGWNNEFLELLVFGRKFDA